VIKGLVDSIRRNHALEHATIAVMLGHRGPMRVIGRAVPDGFYIYADVDGQRLREYSDEALRRLQGGESHLAVSPLCGTNLVVAGVLAGLGSYLAVSSGRRGFDRLATSTLAALVGVIAAQPLGRLAQKHYTTSPDLEGVRIVDVSQMGRGNVHKVRTAPLSAVL
jgi:hypothetical protein